MCTNVNLSWMDIINITFSFKGAEIVAVVLYSETSCWKDCYEKANYFTSNLISVL